MTQSAPCSVDGQLRQSSASAPRDDAHDVTAPHVRLEDRRASRRRRLTGHEHEVDAGVQVEREVRVEDVGVVAHDDNRDELHAASLVATVPGRRSLQRPDADAEPVEVAVEPHDVGLADAAPSAITARRPPRAAVEIDVRRAQARRAAAAQRPQRVAKPRVHDERAGRQPPLELGVVDEERPDRRRPRGPARSRAARDVLAERLVAARRRTPFRSHCSSERNGKWRTSTGCQCGSARQRFVTTLCDP